SELDAPTFYPVKSMNNSNTSANIPHTGWQILGELELPAGSSTDDAIHAWLSEVLHPLGLQAHFLGKVSHAAQEAAGRAMRSERAIELQHLHFLMHAPKHSASNGQTWGFFQIEKMGDSVEGGNAHDHTIEFYLYLEG
ncbi:MAG TPA: hypothetical protein VK900_05055, partial [Anaerolineales bacterium]|nr:hypothetical protein [Anaerolineales bacterium]